MTQFFDSITDAFSNGVRLLVNNNLRWLLLSILHTTLLVAVGYTMVIWSLSPLLKTGLFCLVCLASVFLLYRALMRSGESSALDRN